MTIDTRAVVGAFGNGLCVIAVAVVRPAHLYDEKFDENLGMFYTTVLVLLGAAMAFWGFATSRVDARWRGAGMAVSGLALAAVLFVALHPDDACVLGCGPF